MRRPDLDSAHNVDRFVDLFYARLLNDCVLAPVFLEDAQIDVRTHLPSISLYWQKMLWGDKQYNTNMMKKHRKINAHRPFSTAHYQRWLGYFEQTAKESFSGEYTDKALRIARNVIKNMEKHMRVGE